MNHPAPDAGPQRVALSIDGTVATLTLCRPQMNAIDDAMLEAILDALARVEASPAVILLRVRSDQRVFCAGADLDLVASRVGSADGAAAMVKTVELFHRAYGRLAALPAITIAELEGHALGGGLELALACDLRIAAHHAKLGLPEAKVGLLPGAGGTQRLTGLCGAGVASRLILTGEVIDGREAERLGLVQWTVHAVDFADLASEIAARVAALSPDAARAAKRCIGIASAIAPAGLSAEIEGIGALIRAPATEGYVATFLRR
ncbi:enoyl-CoA hydratase/isomerase family protein [Xanthobacter dioxanivorans]|uniref:Enoyl-CoA hydratase/isomerase family protein n=1 Tax=Xanthobacter dioxanivorans TaxID=2528964 RepID=A0A974SKZ8_9HYPH|nr:enoyl-CoA hydratase/isomerase family protein [Xanthobacter dioxanivorans]QRG09037.1 enoyl-CoA hydratase/isomerase family protein [Xanthobacter dioxanivorans]